MAEAEGGFVPQHFIKCPECKSYIGAVYPLLYYIDLGHRKSKGEQINKLINAPNADGFEGKILDALGIYNICCRIHVRHNIDVEKIY